MPCPPPHLWVCAIAVIISVTCSQNYLIYITAFVFGRTKLLEEKTMRLRLVLEASPCTVYRCEKWEVEEGSCTNGKLVEEEERGGLWHNYSRAELDNILRMSLVPRAAPDDE